MLALAISAVGVAFAIRAFQGGERLPQLVTTSQTPVPPSAIGLTAQVDGRIRLVGLPASVAASEGTVWVTTYNPEDEQAALVRIDAVTNEVVATVPLGQGAGGRVAVGAGAVWVVIGKFPSVQLLRIDASTNEVTGTVGGIHGPVVVGATGVWAIEDGEDERDAAVVRIDPETLEIELRIPVGESPFDMAIGARSVWLVAARGDGGDLVRYDETSGEVAARIPIDSAGIWIAADDSGVWVPGPDPDIPYESAAYFVDASTNAVSGEPGDADHFRPFAIGDGRVWFIGDAGVCGLNVSSRAVDVCAQLDSFPGYEQSLDPATYELNTHSIWIAASEPWITRIDIVPGAGTGALGPDDHRVGGRTSVDGSAEGATYRW